MRKSLLASIALLLFCLASMAATKPSPQSNETALTHNLTWQIEKNSISSIDFFISSYCNGLPGNHEPLTSYKSPIRIDDSNYTLNVNLNYDKANTDIVISGMAFQNGVQNSMFYCDWPDDDTPDNLEFRVPQGSYDIEIILQTKSMDYVVLTAQNVEVANDSDITLNEVDATVEITWIGLMPDGSLMSPEIPIYDLTETDIIDYVPGNVLTVSNVLKVLNTKHDSSIMFVQSYTPKIVGETKLEIGQVNVKIMPNHNYDFYLEKGAIGAEGGYIIPLFATGDQSAVVTNDVTNYVTLKPEFAETPHQAGSKEFNSEGQQVTAEFDRNKTCCLSYAIITNGIMTGNSYLAVVRTDTDLQKWIHVCQDPDLKDKFQIMPIPSLVEDWDRYYHMNGLPVDVSTTTPYVMTINNTAGFNAYLKQPEDRSIYMTDVVNPWLSFDITKPHIWNYGCPILVFSTTESSWSSNFSYAYIGRLGENRGVDLLSTITDVIIDDIDPSGQILENLQWGQLPSEGKMDFVFSNTNVAIDGLPGENVAHVAFDMSRSDWQPPTLQLVRFIDIDNNFIDRYTKGEEGVIELYGGDFTYHYNTENYAQWYTEEPAAEILVEYAPYGTDSFLPLEVENIPEHNFMPGFGSYYRGSLARVDRKSENGWFDVRITLTDAAGNYQEQILSPAFKIENNVGIETITALEIGVIATNENITIYGCDNPVIEIYSADGILHNRVEGKTVDVTGLNHGIYFVNVIERNKHVVRKICI